MATIPNVYKNLFSNLLKSLEEETGHNYELKINNLDTNEYYLIGDPAKKRIVVYDAISDTPYDQLDGQYVNENELRAKMERICDDYTICEKTKSIYAYVDYGMSYNYEIVAKYKYLD
jgi:hypothetical protein